MPLPKALLATLLVITVTDELRAEHRIVSVDGTLTEIVAALGRGEELVGRDRTSTYPPEVKKLPLVGGHPTLNAEGVIALKPTLVLASDDLQPPELADRLRDSGAQVLILPVDKTFDAAIERIETLAATLDRRERGAELIAAIEADRQTLDKKRQALGDRTAPKVLSVYVRGAGAAFLLGESDGLVALVESVGGTTAIPGISGYRPLSAEAVVAAAPDVICVFEKGLQSVGGVDGLLQLPGMKQTPAGRNKRIVAMDGLYVNGFGPRVGQAALELFEALHHENGPHISGR